MGLEKVGVDIGKEIIAWARTGKSLLATRPVKINTRELKYAPELKADTLQISEIQLLFRDLEKQISKSEIYNVTRYQKDFFNKVYNRLKTPEERALYTEKLRLIFDDIQYDKGYDYRHLANDAEKINFIQENFQFLHLFEQERILSLLKRGEIPRKVLFRDNNKMFELVLSDKKYNLDYIEKLMKSRRYSELDEIAPELSRKIDEYITKNGIHCPKKGTHKIPQQLEESEIDRSSYHYLPYYHGVKGEDANYKIQLFKEHGFSRFAPTNGTGTNLLFATEDINYAKEYGRPVKMYLSKDYPIIDIDIRRSTFSPKDRSSERLFYDLCYEKGIKFIRNGRETLILDPTSITFVKDFVP